MFAGRRPVERGDLLREAMQLTVEDALEGEAGDGLGELSRGVVRPAGTWIAAPPSCKRVATVWGGVVLRYNRNLLVESPPCTFVFQQR